MENEIVIIIIYGVGALLCIFIGFFALKYGKDMYFNGIGISNDGSSVEIKGVKTQLKTVGSVVMLTSFAWGFLGWQIFPEYKNSKDETTIGSVQQELIPQNYFASSEFNELENVYLFSLKKDSVSTFTTWKVLAENEIPQAKAIMGYAYKNGIGTEKNIDSSMLWIEKYNKDIGIDITDENNEITFDKIPNKKDKTSHYNNYE